jgi:hypothetical protein
MMRSRQNHTASNQNRNDDDDETASEPRDARLNNVVDFDYGLMSAYDCVPYGPRYW